MVRPTFLVGWCFFMLGCAASPVAPEVSSPRTDTPATAANKKATGRLPPEVIQKIVRENFENFRHCYEDALRRDPMVSGRFSVRFVIGRDGSVSQVSDAGSDIRDPQFMQCVLAAFAPLQFPNPEGGIVTVIYPVMFSQGEGQFRQGDCVVEQKKQEGMLLNTTTCPGWALMTTSMRTNEDVGDAFAEKHLVGFEQGAQGLRTRPVIAGREGWASTISAGSGKPFRKLFITRGNANVAILVSCQDQQATDTSKRCDEGIEGVVRPLEKQKP